ncbi:hypothetical protein AAVH_28989 [Aphelenchoides avenae]|nr:hypothetical protein AAVH_28989 [Aphelenchus avenae]
MKLIRAPHDCKGSSGTKEWKITRDDGGKWDVTHTSGKFADDVIGRCDLEMAFNDRLWYYLPESPPFMLARITLVNPTTLDEFSLPPVVLSMWMTGSRTVDDYTAYRRSPHVKIRLTALPFTTSEQVVEFLAYLTGIKDSKLVTGVAERSYGMEGVNQESRASIADELQKTLLYLSPIVKSIIAGVSALLLAYLVVNGR